MTPLAQVRLQGLRVSPPSLVQVFRRGLWVSETWTLLFRILSVSQIIKDYKIPQIVFSSESETQNPKPKTRSKGVPTGKPETPNPKPAPKESLRENPKPTPPFSRYLFYNWVNNETNHSWGI